MTTEMQVIQPQTFGLAEMERMAAAIAAGGLFAAKTPQQALSLMLVAHANGEHPARACQMYDIIDGRPCMKSQAMLAKFHEAGGKTRWIERTDEAVECEFSHPSGGTLKVRWTLEMAKRAGLAGKANWLKHPRQMMSARVIGEGVRAVLPGAILGFYAPEEIGGEAIDVTPLPAAPAAPLLQVAATVAPATPAEVVQPAAPDLLVSDNNRRQLLDLIGEDEKAANTVLTDAKMILPGQTWVALSDSNVAAVLKRADGFKKAIAKAKAGGAA